MPAVLDARDLALGSAVSRSAAGGELSADLAHDEIPVSEIEGQAAHRRAADSKPSGKKS